MTPFDALSEMPNLVADYKATAARLMEAERELVALKTERYVPLEWVAELWSVEPKTAREMLKTLSTGRKGQTDLKVLAYGAKVVRYRKSDILAITEINLVALKDNLIQKAETRRRSADAVRKDKTGQQARSVH